MKGCALKVCFFPPLIQVDEIMLTLKQAFSKAVEWKKSNPQWQQCDACPLLQFHRLCERIEGGKLFLHCYASFEKTQIGSCIAITFSHFLSNKKEILIILAIAATSLKLLLSSRVQHFSSTDSVCHARSFAWQYEHK